MRREEQYGAIVCCRKSMVLQYIAHSDADPEGRQQYLNKEKERWREDRREGRKKEVSDLSKREKREKKGKKGGES